MNSNYKSLVQIAMGIKDGSLKAVDVLEEHIARIDARESEIHAFNKLTLDDARANAARVDADAVAGRPLAPLAGVPIALKDNMCTRGVETTCSSKMLANW